MDEGGDFFYEEDKMGMTLTSGASTLQKDANNLIGISIGGGAPLCPCLYIVQIFDGSPAAKDTSLEAGDEITGVNRVSVKGKTKTDVARIIQASKGEVTIQYNKLHADPKQGKTLDIVLKKLKHKMIENMSANTADALGLSRAILCNDSLVKKLEELERNADLYRGLIDHTKKILNAHYQLAKIHREFGDIFNEIGTREQQVSACEAFMTFGDAHRNMEKNGEKLLSVLKPMLCDLNTFLTKAVPDTRLTLKKYLDVKFEYLRHFSIRINNTDVIRKYMFIVNRMTCHPRELVLINIPQPALLACLLCLSYCLKIKEMDDEEVQFAALQEPLYRVETGNYEYRLILRCRQEAKLRFAKLRSDVLVKMELLDQKHVQDIVFQLQRLVAAMSSYHENCKVVNEPTRGLFPIEVDLSQVAIKYNATGQLPADDEEEEQVEEAKEADDEPLDLLGGNVPNGEKLTTEKHLDFGTMPTSSVNRPAESALFGDLEGLSLTTSTNVPSQSVDLLGDF